MSEYQYYEFLALDRRLTDKEMKEIRTVSSRAEITPTSFANEYNYGDFKGDEYEFLKRYFDAYSTVAFENYPVSGIPDDPIPTSP